MFFITWYFTMIFIIMATSGCLNFWMRKKGYERISKPTFRQTVTGWVFVLVPILNIFLGMLAFLILLLFTFKEEVMIELFDTNPNYKKVDK